LGCARQNPTRLELEAKKMATKKTATARALIDPEIKQRAEGILGSLGLSVSNAFDLFYRQVIAHRDLPFEVRIANEQTMKAIEDSRVGKGKRFSTASELFKDLGM
jgi:DNA-damage-inducible protein J